RRRRHIALITRSVRNSSIGPAGERFPRTRLKSSSKAAVFFWENDITCKWPCRSALRRTAAFPSDVFGPVEWRALARLASFRRLLVIFFGFCSARTGDVFVQYRVRTETNLIRIAFSVWRHPSARIYRVTIVGLREVLLPDWLAPSSLEHQRP